MRCNARSACAGSRASAKAMRVIFHEILVQSRARIREGGRRTVDVCLLCKKSGRPIKTGRESAWRAIGSRRGHSWGRRTLKVEDPGRKELSAKDLSRFGTGQRAKEN